MPYDYMNELQSVKKYYEGDPLQKRFSALITGETNAGKTFLLRTARKPVFIDSFDPGGTKGLRDLIKSGDIVVDTSWEADDPFSPDKFEKWMKAIERRFQIGFFEHFGTYALDSATTWGDAVMAYGLKAKGRAGQQPQRNHDYVPQKIHMENYIKKLMRIPCDFFLTGHLKENRKVLSVDSKTGVVREEVNYRFFTTGQALITIPLLFDEIYVLLGKDSYGGAPKRKIVTDSLGTYIARSRLKAKGLLDYEEEPDIKALLKKAGFSSEDKPPIKWEEINEQKAG